MGWIVLPFFAALALGLFPKPIQVQDKMKTARAAMIEGNPGEVSDSLAGVLAFNPERGDLWAMAGGNALAAGRASQAVIDYQTAGRLWDSRD